VGPHYRDGEALPPFEVVSANSCFVGSLSFDACFGVGGELLPSFFLFQNSSLYQDFVEVVNCNEMEVSADPPCCESGES
jgi:hypothetical protein